MDRKIALVTGASRKVGIGAAIACRLASLDMDVFITYYRPYDHESGLAAPHHFEHLAGLELGRIHFHRRPKRFGPCARLPRGQERNRRERNSDRAGADCSRRQQAAPAMVNLITHSIAPKHC